MRKIFIALFLIFFAHCECVLAITTGNVGGNVGGIGGGGDCGTCGEGYFCEKLGNECKRIPAGFYKEDDSGQLKLCKENYKCPGWSLPDGAEEPVYANMTKCESGWFSGVGYSSCFKEDNNPAGIDTAGKNYANSDCPIYQFCTARSGGNKWCLTYDFYTAEYDDFYNNYTYDEVLTRIQNASVDIRDDPAAVLAKLACPSKGTACPKGYFCPPGLNFITLCNDSQDCAEAGTESPAGYYSAIDPNILYSDEFKGNTAAMYKSNKFPHPCPAGYYCPRNTRFYAYSEANKGGGLCPAGYYCPVGTGEKLECGLGTYSSAGRTECKKCDPGEYQDQEGQSSCKDCPAGKYSDQDGAPHCVDCSAGTYQDEKGQSTCKNCLAGWYSGASGSTECTKCPAGRFSTGGSAECTKCPAGTYQNKEGQSSCKYCSAGTYSDNEGSSACKRCPTGTTTSGDGADSMEACNLCEAGYYKTPLADGSSTCTQCPTETPISGPGSDDISDCRAITKCSDVALIAGCGGSDDNAARITTCRNLEGCYWNETEKICANCTDGFYCTNCSEKRVKCPDGTTSKEGAKQKSDCYLEDNKLKQNNTKIEIPYTGELYFYTTVLEICDQLSAVCQAPGGTGGTGGTGAGGIVSQK